ncbi:hypothetical protein [Streptomyces diastatochromogenes]|uniref:Uncharacterized protein n=1 Tax=Streptomyces diastatochromogenes TaxID=42236 RepID=A0A233SG98_STRDA|nr:hypothetical protein [Streptomyces diastatochromogenes]OXY94666.1 hypothetical protein BEK98_18960 [Streptomyces diastatochromogenes]
MHHHGYLWVGAKERFDQEALRRPPHPEPPPAGSKPELIQRYREVAAEFATVDLPPLETAYWLVKPRSLVRGTWGEAKDAAAWIGARVAEYAPRFASEGERCFIDLALLANSTAEKLSSGGDVSLGFYLERPSYLSLAVVTCSPNRTKPELACLVEQGETV